MSMYNTETQKYRGINWSRTVTDLFTVVSLISSQEDYEMSTQFINSGLRRVDTPRPAIAWRTVTDDDKKILGDIPLTDDRVITRIGNYDFDFDCRNGIFVHYLGDYTYDTDDTIIAREKIKSLHFDLVAKFN